MKRLIVLALVLQGCSLGQFDMEKDPFAQQLPGTFQEQANKDRATDLTTDSEYAKANHGIVNIHRHGPGYDVMMMLNAGESDIIFSMDLPPGADVPVANGNKVLKRSNGDKPETMSEEGEVFNEKAVALFSSATKHMLNAQALFYRKSYWKALEETNRAMSLVPSSAQAHALKGSIYYRMGRKSDARESWEKALSLDPTLNDVKESLRLVR
ncbi:tetratricopeptide repeat protein [Bermanella sp. R86510]|uniref:tetratricopeptide repeat protein n=1 Tax=unclassified Bermanella TaxID=2627862 RepID=UPI0037CC0EFF